jgi:hypothetical protein
VAQAHTAHAVARTPHPNKALSDHHRASVTLPEAQKVVDGGEVDLYVADPVCTLTNVIIVSFHLVDWFIKIGWDSK